MNSNPSKRLRANRAGWRVGLCILIFAAFAFTTQTDGGDQQPGRIVEMVSCIHNANQTYALYLPSNYTENRMWPILFAFDAAARGLLPVQRFRAGAEKLGYIVVGSNNARNGPIDSAEEALNALVEDAESRFSLNPRRFYMTGFSGGARVAVAAAAAMQGRVAGVIGCGAGFHSEIPPSAARHFAFIGIIGMEDFNFPEMRALDGALEQIGAAHRLEIFQGDHDWPPESFCTHALEWLEIQAMKSGLRSLDEALIDTVYSREEAEVRACESKGEIYRTFQQYSALARDFDGLKDVEAVKARAIELRESKDLARAVKREEAIDEKQQRLQAEILGMVEDILAYKNRAFRLQELARNFISLRSMASRTGNEADRLAAARVLAFLWMRFNEDAARDLQSRKYGAASLRLELMGQIQPENPGVFYRLSRIYAVDGNKKAALKALKSAVKKGFKNAADLETNPDFEAIRTDPAFLDILEALRK